MDVILQAMEVVMRSLSSSTSLTQMEVAQRLRQWSQELERSALASLDYELIGDPRKEQVS